MSRFQKYTVMARKSAFKYPILTAVLTQVNFWIIAYMVLAGILHNYALFINTLVDQDTGYAPVPAFLGSFIMACFYGTTLGFADYFMFRRWSSKRSVGLLIVLKGLFYLLVMSLLFVFMRKILFERFFFIYFFSPTAPFLNSENWKFFFRILGIYTLAMGLVISFINQMNSKFGPGVLIPILLGKYLKPHKEERIFMFLDLANSTTLAE